MIPITSLKTPQLVQGIGQFPTKVRFSAEPDFLDFYIGDARLAMSIKLNMAALQLQEALSKIPLTNLEKRTAVRQGILTLRKLELGVENEGGWGQTIRQLFQAPSIYLQILKIGQEEAVIQKALSAREKMTEDMLKQLPAVRPEYKDDAEHSAKNLKEASDALDSLNKDLLAKLVLERQILQAELKPMSRSEALLQINQPDFWEGMVALLA